MRSRIASGSGIRPGPIFLQASSPVSGGRMRYPCFSNRATFSATIGFSNIEVVIAGHNRTGQVTVSKVVERRSSASPEASFPRQLAVAGATTRASAQSAMAMWAISVRSRASFEGHMVEYTGRSVRVASTSGVTNCLAFSVMTAWTSASSFLSSRTSRGVL